VAPAAHYTVGGIVTDLDGRSTVAGLYAAGECACTGVHGANRLASNSLLECLVFGRRAALAALDEPARSARPRSGPGEGVWGNREVPPAELAVPITPEIRRALWQHAGVIRNADGLRELLSTPALLPRLVAESALARRESRGGHFRSDYPTEDAAFAGHVVLRHGREPELEQWS
jgi:L-aspartate oxidase